MFIVEQESPEETTEDGEDGKENITKICKDNYKYLQFLPC